MASGGSGFPAARATRTLPSASVDVAASKMKRRARPGTESAHGLVPRNRARPPNGTTPPIPAPTAPTVTIPIRPSAAVRSAYSPSRPMWVECRTATIATPCCRARAIAHSRANIVECWPKPRRASTRAATAVSRATTGRAEGTMCP